MVVSRPTRPSGRRLLPGLPGIIVCKLLEVLVMVSAMSRRGGAVTVVTQTVMRDANWVMGSAGGGWSGT
jgi:hypothetical protein